MAKHTVLIAVTVDDKYTADDVRKELEYVTPFCSSDLLDTLTGMYAVHTKRQAKMYQVWNSEHIAMYADKPSGTHAELVALEKATDCSYSTFITTDDIESIVTAVQNEWNGELQYQLTEV